MKYYFASDVHLGLDGGSNPKEREERFICFLKSVHKGLKEHGGALFLLGDIFDFWFEYRYVVPKGHSKVLSAISDITRDGFKVHFFKGNHDMWSCGYLQSECGMIVHDSVAEFELLGKRFLMGHGDYLGVDAIKNPSYFLMHKIFTSALAYKICRCIVHPDIVMWFGSSWSLSSRKSRTIEHVFREEKEPIVNFCRGYNSSEIDYFVFGHLHCETTYSLGDSSLFILGNWINSSSFLVYDGVGEPKFLNF